MLIVNATAYWRTATGGSRDENNVSKVGDSHITFAFYAPELC